MLLGDAQLLVHSDTLLFMYPEGVVEVVGIVGRTELTNHDATIAGAGSSCEQARASHK